MDAHCCLEAVEQAKARCGKPEVVNTDQSSLFTSQIFTALLKDDLQISMNGKGFWRDYVFVERSWRSIKL